MKNKSGINKSTIFSGIGVVLIGTYIFLTTFTFKEPLTSRSSPRMFPQAVGVLLVVLGLVLIIREIIWYRSNFYEKKTITIGNVRTLLTVMGATVAYAIVMKPIGFILATFLYLSGMFFALDPRLNKLWIKAIISAVFTAILYVAFGILFKASLPSGILF